MGNHSRWLDAAASLLVIWLLGMSALRASGREAYLPAVGPVPIRFQFPAPLVAIAFWPPLIKREHVALHPDQQLTNAPVVDVMGPIPLTNSVPEPTVITASPDIPPAPPAPVVPFQMPGVNGPAQPPPGAIDPQTLLNSLLVTPTNDSGARVVMPLFVPPAPPQAFPSSHATYESR